MFRRAKFRLLFFPSSSRIQLIELGKRARVEKTWNKRLCRRGGERGTRERKIGKREKRRNGEVEKLEWNKVEGDRGGEGEQKRTERESVTPAPGKKLAAIIIYSTSCFLSVPLPPSPPPIFFPPSSSLSKLHLPRVVVALNPILGALLFSRCEMPAY